MRSVNARCFGAPLTEGHIAKPTLGSASSRVFPTRRLVRARLCQRVTVMRTGRPTVACLIGLPKSGHDRIAAWGRVRRNRSVSGAMSGRPLWEVLRLAALLMSAMRCTPTSREGGDLTSANRRGRRLRVAQDPRIAFPQSGRPEWPSQAGSRRAVGGMRRSRCVLAFRRPHVPFNETCRAPEASK